MKPDIWVMLICPFKTKLEFYFLEISASNSGDKSEDKKYFKFHYLQEIRFFNIILEL